MAKILHTVNIPFVIPFILGDQITYFTGKGHEIHVACSTGGNLETYRTKWNFKLLNIVISRKISLLQDLVSIFNLIIYIKKYKIDIVVGHTPKGALVAMIASFFSGVSKRIYFRHGLMFETSHGLKKLLFIFIERTTSIFSTEIICVSNSVLNQSIKLRLSSERKMKIINKGSCNGVDAALQFNRNNLDPKLINDIKFNLKLTSTDFVVGYIGRLARDKGINELILAWDLVKLKNKNSKLVLCGPLDERDPIDIDLYQKIFNDHTILLVGEITNPEYYYALFSLFILPSYREGFPTVVLEASAMELPVITTNSTGCIDSIIDGETGIITSITPSGICDSIFYYMENSSLVESHGLKGRNHILKNYQNIDIWKQLEYIYEF